MKNVLKVFMMSALAIGSVSHANSGQLPELGKITTHVFLRPYSCNYNAKYDGAALFLSEASKENNDPELLFNGHCDGSQYLDPMVGERDRVWIRDLGDIQLESITNKVLLQIAPTDGDAPLGRDAYVTRYGMSLQEDKIYAIFMEKPNKRGVFIIRIDAASKSGRLAIRYVVKSYTVITSKGRLPATRPGRKPVSVRR